MAPTTPRSPTRKTSPFHEPATRPPASPTRRLFTVPETAAKLACCRQHVHNLIARGLLTTVKCGRLRRVPESAIEEFIARNTVPATAG